MRTVLPGDEISAAFEVVHPVPQREVIANAHAACSPITPTLHPFTTLISHLRIYRIELSRDINRLQTKGSPARLLRVFDSDGSADTSMLAEMGDGMSVRQSSNK